MSVSPVPQGYPTVSPYLVVDKPEQVLDFTVNALGAEVTERMEGPEGGIRHAEVKIGTSVIMMGPSRPDCPAMPTMLYLYMEDCDAAYAKALEAGATSEQEPTDMPYGDRTAAVKDACGNFWHLATRKENLTSEEMAERMNTQSDDA